MKIDTRLYKRIWDFLSLDSNGVKLMYNPISEKLEVQELSIDKITPCKTGQDIAIYLLKYEFTQDALKNLLDHYTDISDKDTLEIQQQFFNYRQQLLNIKDGATC